MKVGSLNMNDILSENILSNIYVFFFAFRRDNLQCAKKNVNAI